MVVTPRGLAVKLQTPRHASGRYERETSDLYVVRMLGPPETWMVPEAAVSNSTEVVEKMFIAEHGGQRSQASML
jgi:hypothetical protein